MKRIRMTVAYDGTNYCGWQVQPNGITIEQVLNEKLSILLGEEIVVSGASRTDSGVHSLGNICVFDTNTRMPGDKICYAINQSLPDDVVVVDSAEVPDDWHPRYVNSTKTYEYRILNRKFPDPTRRLDTYFFHYKLDVYKMQRAADILVGEHDFKSFCSAGSQVKTTVRTIYSCDVNKKDDVITIRIKGNGFLYNMVRIIVGTLLDIANSKIKLSDMHEIIESRDRSRAGATAPAEGLYLNRVIFRTFE